MLEFDTKCGLGKLVYKPLYERVYCARGRMENMIEEYKLYTRSDRT